MGGRNRMMEPAVGGGLLFHVRPGPGGGIRQDGLDQRDVHGVTGRVRLDQAHEGSPQGGQVAHEVQHLVADRLVLEAQGLVQGPFGAEDHRVVQAAAEGEALGAHELDVPVHAEGPGGAQLPAELLRGQGQLAGLPADGGMVEVDGVAQPQPRIGGDLHPLAALPHFDRTEDPDDAPGAGDDAGAGFGQRLDPGGRAAVQDRELCAVHFDDGVLDLQTGQGGQQVFHGAELHAVPAQGRGQAQVAHQLRLRRDQSPGGRVEELQPGRLLHGPEGDPAGEVRVQAPAFDGDGVAEGLQVAGRHIGSEHLYARSVPLFI